MWCYDTEDRETGVRQSAEEEIRGEINIDRLKKFIFTALMCKVLANMVLTRSIWLGLPIVSLTNYIFISEFLPRIV